MASSSKATGVHYALVFFVLATIVCGLGWLLAYKGQGSIGELTEQKKKLDGDAKANKAAFDKTFEELKKLKDLAGTKFEDMGDGTNSNTVSGRIAVIQRQYGGGLASQTLD